MIPAMLKDTVESQSSSNGYDYVPGTLDGHMVPTYGWFFAGLYYLTMALKYYYDCKLQRTKFRASVEMPYRCNGIKIPPFINIKPFRIPIAAWVKLIFGGFYILHDFSDHTIYKMKPMKKYGHFQHDTIATTFILSGLVDLLCMWPHIGQYLPPSIDYFLFSVTFFTEVLQFLTHLNGRTPVDVRLHQIQASIAALTLLALAVEACNRKNAAFSVIRGFILTLQGTWMFQLSMILYHPLGIRPMDLHSDENVMLVSLTCAGHIILLSWLTLALNLVFVWTYKSAIRKRKRSHDVTPLMVMSPGSH